MAAAPPFAAPLAPIRKGRKVGMNAIVCYTQINFDLAQEQRFDDDGQPLMTEDEQRKILQVFGGEGLGLPRSG